MRRRSRPDGDGWRRREWKCREQWYTAITQQTIADETKEKIRKKYRNALGDGGSAADLCEHARMEEELALHRGGEHYLQVQ